MEWLKRVKGVKKRQCTLANAVFVLSIVLNTLVGGHDALDQFFRDLPKLETPTSKVAESIILFLLIMFYLSTTSYVLYGIKKGVDGKIEEAHLFPSEKAKKQNGKKKRNAAKKQIKK